MSPENQCSQLGHLFETAVTQRRKNISQQIIFLSFHRLPAGLFPSGFLPNFLKIFLLCRACYMPHSYYSPKFRRLNNSYMCGKPEEKIQTGRPSRRWEHNIKTNLQEMGWGGMDWIDMAQDRDRWRMLVNAVMKFLIT